MLTDWLRIMLDEIARKQAERESARAEQQARELESAPARSESKRKPTRAEPEPRR
ncbi:MAG TPA: hypothetical protein VH542_02665 [Steroidobacteraceae bacterium]|jgi:hypothetical protein